MTNWTPSAEAVERIRLVLDDHGFNLHRADVHTIARAVWAESPGPRMAGLLAEIAADDCVEQYQTPLGRELPGDCEDYAESADVLPCLSCRARALLRELEAKE
jgi:hypothetical protein